MTSKNQVSLLYFAQLREKIGLDQEKMDISSGETGRSLFYKLCERYTLSFQPEFFRVAINEEFASFDQELSCGDEIAYIPPVAGG